MRLISDGNTLSRLLVRLAEKHDQVAFAVAWASSGIKILEHIKNNKSKIKHGVIGTHFYQTHPDVLDMFVGFNSVHFVLQPSGVFHPKAYCFWSKENWDLVIGSANMTKAAFGANQELSLHVSSNDMDETDSLSRETRDTIKAMWELGTVMDKQAAMTYRSMYKIQKPRADSLSGGYASNKKSKSPLKSAIMSMEWDGYFARVKADEEHNVDGRCFILESANKEFRKHSFASMNIDWRRAIAGLNNDFLEQNWGWFGSMIGAGKFKNRINSNDIHLSNALDLISLNGAVTYQDYLTYIEEFKKAFPDGRDGVALASRLLALKRPDYFVCLNAKNMRALCKEFEIKNIYARDYERYWTELIARIVDSVWWNSPLPVTKLEGRVWRGRAAMLDAIFYDPDA